MMEIENTQKCFEMLWRKTERTDRCLSCRTDAIVPEEC